MQGMYAVASHGSNKRKASVMLCTEAGSSGSAVHAVSWLLHSFCVSIESPPYRAGYRPPSFLPQELVLDTMHWCFQVDTSQGLHCKTIPKWTLILATPVIKVLYTCTHHCTHCPHGDVAVGAMSRVVYLIMEIINVQFAQLQ